MNATGMQAGFRSDGRVLVTGGSGFVGRAVVSALLAAGTPVTNVDLKPSPVTDPMLHTVQGDLNDAAVRAEALTPEVTAVVHLAAITSVLRSAEQPQQTFQTNVVVTGELLELARQRGVTSFVLASSNSVIGDVGTARITEDLPLRPLTPYGATKAACEMLLSGYTHCYPMRAATLRFTNIYGPGMAAKDSFVPRLMRAALAGEGVCVYGDGQQQRDLVHLDDVVAAILQALRRGFRGTAIVGAESSVSVLELVESARAATGAPLPVEHVPAQSGEMPAVIVDIGTAREELGYQPTMSLTAGLKTVWEDFRASEVGFSGS